MPIVANGGNPADALLAPPVLAPERAPPPRPPSPDVVVDDDDLVMWDDEIHGIGDPNTGHAAQNNNPAPRFGLKCVNHEGRCEISTNQEAVDHINELLNMTVEAVDVSRCVAKLIKHFGCSVESEVLAKGIQLLGNLDINRISSDAAETLVPIVFKLSLEANGDKRTELLTIAAHLCGKRSARLKMARFRRRGGEEYPISKVMDMFANFLDSDNTSGAIAALNLVDKAFESGDVLRSFNERAANHRLVLRALQFDEADLAFRYYVVRIIAQSCEDADVWPRYLDALPTLFDVLQQALNGKYYGVVAEVLSTFAVDGFLHNRLPEDYANRAATAVRQLEERLKTEGESSDWMDSIKQFLGIPTCKEIKAAERAEKEALRAADKRRRKLERRHSELATEKHVDRGFEGNNAAVGRILFVPLTDCYDQAAAGPSAIDVSKYLTKAQIVAQSTDGWWICRYEPFVHIDVVLDPDDEDGDLLELMPEGDERYMTLTGPDLHWDRLPDGFTLVDTFEKLCAIEKTAWPAVFKIRQNKLKRIEANKPKPNRSRGRKRNSDVLEE